MVTPLFNAEYIRN